VVPAVSSEPLENDHEACLDVGIFVVHVVNYIFHCHSFAPVVIADVLARLDWPADEEAPAGSWQCGVAGVT